MNMHNDASLAHLVDKLDITIPSATRIIGWERRLIRVRAFAAVVFRKAIRVCCRKINLAFFWIAGIVTSRARSREWKIPGSSILLNAQLYERNEIEAMKVRPKLYI